MVDLTNEQLVSFINFQIGQKQGWESLGRVIELVNNSDKLVALAKEQAALYLKEVEEMKQSLVILEQTRKAKEADLDLAAARQREALLTSAQGAVKEAHAKADAMHTDLASLAQRQALAEANVAKVEAQLLGLQRQKVAAEGDLVGIQKRIADIKASL
jgi:predicted  nucleic acid-binding Zn-ribbon protein